MGGTTNLIVTAVSDNGVPPLSATNSFLVVVRGWYAGIDLTDPTAATADPTGDGFSNLLKYALGLDPRNPADNQNGLVVTTRQAQGANYLIMSFRRRKNAPWLTYIPEVSGDRQAWCRRQQSAPLRNPSRSYSWISLNSCPD